jgi:hypothetical protein
LTLSGCRWHAKGNASPILPCRSSSSMTVAHIGLLEPSCGAFPSMNKPCFARERATKVHSDTCLGCFKYDSYRLFCSRTIRTGVNRNALNVCVLTLKNPIVRPRFMPPSSNSPAFRTRDRITIYHMNNRQQCIDSQARTFASSP